MNDKAGINVKKITGYVQENGIIRLENGNMIGRLSEDCMSYEALPIPRFISNPETDILIQEVSIIMRRFKNDHNEVLPHNFQIKIIDRDDKFGTFTTTSLQEALQALLNRMD